MITKITGEHPFQVLTNNFSISPSAEGYTLQISADGVNYSNLFTVSANTTRLVTGVAANSYYRLLGNNSQVSINWMKTCVTEGQGGGGNAGELEPVSEFPVGVPEGTVVALASGDTVGVYQYDGSEWMPVAGGDLSNYYTKAETNAAITAATASETARTEQTYAKIADIPSLDGYWTSAQTNNAISAATTPIQNQVDDVERVTASALTSLQESKQDTLVSGTNIKTINNQSLLGSGNIDIQGGGGGDNVVELTKAEYDALNPPAADTTYIITDADVVDLNDYAPASGLTELSGTVQTLSTTVSGKADKQNVTANSSTPYFPAWNKQGVITGNGTRAYISAHDVNGARYNIYRDSPNSMQAIYAPTSKGTAGQVLQSPSSGNAPTWSAYKFAFITQTAYDALTTKDATTIYFIIGD